MTWAPPDTSHTSKYLQLPSGSCTRSMAVLLQRGNTGGAEEKRPGHIKNRKSKSKPVSKLIVREGKKLTQIADGCWPSLTSSSLSHWTLLQSCAEGGSEQERAARGTRSPPAGAHPKSAGQRQGAPRPPHLLHLEEFVKECVCLLIAKFMRLVTKLQNYEICSPGARLTFLSDTGGGSGRRKKKNSEGRRSGEDRGGRETPTEGPIQKCPLFFFLLSRCHIPQIWEMGLVTLAPF